MNVFHQISVSKSVFFIATRPKKYGWQCLGHNFWSLVMVLLVMLFSVVGCAHTSWGDGWAGGERYYYFIKSNYHEIEQQNKAALDNMSKASDLDQNSAYLKLETARLHSRNGDEDGALKYARQSIDLDPTSPGPRLFAAWIAAAGGRWREALSFYQQVLNLDPKNVEALTHLGALYSETGQFKEAESTLKKLVAADSGYLSYYYLGRFYAGTGRSREAIKAFSQALKKNPQFVAVLTELANLYEKIDNQSGMERTYRALIKAVPDSDVPRLRLANVLIKTGRLTEAKKILSQTKGKETVQTQVGLIYMDLKKYNLAAKEFEATLAQNPLNDSARYFLASAQFEQNLVEKARINLKAIATDSDLYVDSQLLLASTTQGEDENARLEEALQIINKAIKLAPQQPRLNLAQAMILEEKGEINQARAILINGIKAFPKDSELQFRLGVLEDKLGDKQATIAAMRRAIELNPNHADALNYLAYTWAEKQENLPEALTLAQKADNLKPNSGYIIDTMAWIIFHMGDTNKALELLQKAVPLSGQDPVILDHLGDAYLRMGMTKEALDAYHQALEKGSTNPEELHEKIKRLEK